MITFTKHLKNSARFFCLAAAFAAFSSAWATDGKLRVRHLAREHNLITVQDARRYLLLPIQDNAPEAKVCLIGTDNLAATETVNRAAGPLRLCGRGGHGRRAWHACRCPLLEGTGAGGHL